MGPGKASVCSAWKTRYHPWGVTTVPDALRSSLSRVYQHYPAGIPSLLRSYTATCDSLLIDFSAAHPRPGYGKPRTYTAEEK